MFEMVMVFGLVLVWLGLRRRRAAPLVVVPVVVPVVVVVEPAFTPLNSGDMQWLGRQQ